MIKCIRCGNGFQGSWTGECYACEQVSVEDWVNNAMFQRVEWVDVESGPLPEVGERVLARYVGVYDCRVVTFWRDGGGQPHFGSPGEKDGKGSQPVTHWTPYPLLKKEKISSPGEAVQAILIAAINTAAIEGKISQIQVRLVPKGRSKPETMRIVVMPEKMNWNWMPGTEPGTPHS